MNKIEAVNAVRVFANEVMSLKSFTFGEGALYGYFLRDVAEYLEQSQLQGEFSFRTSSRYDVHLVMVNQNNKNIDLVQLSMYKFWEASKDSCKTHVSNERQALRKVIKVCEAFVA